MSEQSALEQLPLLSLASPDVRALLAASFEPVTYAFGDTIVNEGAESDALYVITSGLARVVATGEDGQEVALGTLRSGDSFGEVGILDGGRRTATVRASGAVEVLRLDASIFTAMLRTNPGVREWANTIAARRRLGNFLRLRSEYAELPATVLAALVEEMVPVEVVVGEVVIQQGDPVGPLFVVQEGRLQAWRDGNAVEFLRAGDAFGERSLLLDEPRDATVVALTDCRLLALQPEAVRTLTTAHPELRKQMEEEVARYGYRQVARVPLDFAEELLPADARAATSTGDNGPSPHEDSPPAEELAPPGEPGRATRRIRRFPLVWQIDEMDCGAACLAMVCRHFGKRVDLAYVRQSVGTGHDGTSLSGLVEGADRLGLAARTLKASKANAARLTLPAICHWDGYHWVVLYDANERHVRFADPAQGLRKVSRAEWDEKWSGFCALPEPTPALANAPEPRPVWGWLAPFFRPYLGTVVRAVVLALVAAGLQMLIPVLAGVIVDQVVARQDRGLLHLVALAMIGVLVVAVGASLVQRLLLARLAVRFDAATLDHITARLLALPLAYFGARRTGDIERRLAGMRQVRVYLVQQGVVGLTAAAQVVVALVLMFAYSPRLAAVYVATVPLYVVAMRYSRRRLRPLLASLEEAFGRYHSRQVDAIEGIETVKARGAENALAEIMRRQFAELSNRVYRADLAFMGYDAVVQLLTFLTLALVLWVGGGLVLGGQLSVGELVAFNGLVVLTNGPVSVVLRLWDELQYASVLLGRLDDVLAHEPEQGADRSRLRPVPTLEGRVSLQGVGFHYGGSARPVPILEDITLEVEPGTTVALVGRSGAGKTTLAMCLVGLLEPTSGRIRYDGVDLATLDYRDLRRRVGFVLQNDHIFDDTIAANIALGSAPDMEQVRWAAGVASAAEFIERLPLGYATKVGDSGLRLSGGQAQRISIARALYGRPPVLILDEATSSLDTDSERAVKDNLGKLLTGCTAFVIAHRLSTVRDADLIVVLERGRIAERGTHDELVRRRGLYWYLVSQQLE